MNDNKHRIEKDSMGEMLVPEWVLWGAQTQRAIENFPISGLRFQKEFIKAIGMIKFAAAEINVKLGILDPKVAKYIKEAAQEVIDGKLDEHFVLDIFQTGSGTSTNMNANEVIANRAMQLANQPNIKIHPNDHVNMGQSSNDVIPAAIHIASMISIQKKLLPSLRYVHLALLGKSREFKEIIKIGRTHLQDATPITLGQEFSGYAAMIEHGIKHLESKLDHLSELAIGGTAVGTGINTHPDFGKLMAKRISELSSITFKEAANHFEAQATKDAIVAISGSLKLLAISLTKISNDIRWLGSGPRCGIGEIIIPAVQPGSSIMPGKVNPVMAESLLMVCAQVIGNDLTISIGAMSGNFELNVMMPVIAYNIIQSIELLSTVIKEFNDKCLIGITANEKRCQEMIEKSLAMVTSLAPVIGYDKAAELAKIAYQENKTIRQVATELNILPKEKLDELLSPQNMINSKPNSKE
jgi:fumarate hydratase, class II